MQHKSSPYIEISDQLRDDSHLDDLTEWICERSVDDQNILMFAAGRFNDIAANQSLFAIPPVDVTPFDNATATDSSPVPLSRSNSVDEAQLIITSPTESTDPIDIVYQFGPPVLKDLDLTDKPKRRRTERRFSYSGSNRFGRKGTIRCERCRHWRRKV
jgi:hypothetical protein